MPVPTFTGLGPDPQYGDIVNKVNRLTAELTNLMLSLDSLNVVSLTADHIDTGTLNANLVTIRSDLVGSSYLQLDGNGIRANNGVINTFEISTSGDAFFRGKFEAKHAIIGDETTPATINIHYGTNKYIQMQGATTTSTETFLMGFASSPGGTPSNLARADFLATLLNFGTGVNFIEFQTNTGLITSTYLRTRSDAEIGGVLDVLGNAFFAQNAAFNGTVSGLITNTISDHNHGVTPGRYLKTYDNAGVELGLQVWNASGGHAHTVTT